MALNPKQSNTAVNAAADAACALLNSGYLRIYDGTQPTTVDTAITTQNLIAELRFGNPAFYGAIAGIATAEPITEEDNALYTGTAAWFRALKSDGVTAVFDGSVGLSGCDLNLDVIAIQITANVSVTAFTYTQPKS